MKFLMKAIDGEFLLDHKPDDGWGLNKWEPGMFGDLVSPDGVNRASALDDEAAVLVAIVHGVWEPSEADILESLYTEYAAIAAEDPDHDGDFINAMDYINAMNAEAEAEWAMERRVYDGGPSVESDLYAKLEAYAPEAFSNGDGTGQVDMRLLPAGW